MILATLRSISLTAVLIAGLQAAELNGATLGTWISGPKISTIDLVDKVVIFEYWGINCPPCLANIPHISELATLADSDRLVVVANQCQGPGSTSKVWKEHDGTDKPTVIDDGNLPGSNVTGIPRIFVFDHTGKQVFDGQPSDVNSAMINKLLDAAPGPFFPKGDYRLCKAEIAALSSKSGNLTATLKSLRGKMQKGKDDVKAEAESLLAHVQTLLDKKMVAITAARVDDAALAVTLLSKVLDRVKGDEMAKPFEALVVDMKTDKSFQRELAASNKLALIQTAISKAKLDKSDVQASKKREVLEAVQALDSLMTAYSDTKAAITAKSIRAQLNG